MIVRILSRPFGNTSAWGVIDEAAGTISFFGRPDDEYTADLGRLRNSTEWAWEPATGRIPGYVRAAANA